MFTRTILFAVAAMVAPIFAGEGWMTDLNAAKKQAAAENKDLLIEFTGSDWCPPCMALKKILDTPEFAKLAKESNYILVELDYPRNKEQSEAVKKENAKWSKEYGIEGFPTIFFTQADGRPFGGFVGGKPDFAAVKAEIDKAAEKKKSIVLALSVAKDMTGVDKAKALYTVYQDLPEMARPFYKELKEEIKSLDKEDSLGFVKADAKKGLMEKEQKEVEAIAMKLGDLAPAEILLKLDDLFKKDYLPETKAMISLLRVQFLLMTKKFDEAITSLDKAVELAPDSEAGQYAVRLKTVLLKDKDKILADMEKFSKAQEEKSAEKSKAKN